jgi:hypothetical protein
METLYKNKTLINLKLATPAVIQPYIVSMLFVKHADWLLLIMLKLNLGPTKQYEFWIIIYFRGRQWKGVQTSYISFIKLSETNTWNLSLLWSLKYFWYFINIER